MSIIPYYSQEHDYLFGNGDNINLENSSEQSKIKRANIKNFD
jgi:hypothetical protein